MLYYNPTIEGWCLGVPFWSHCIILPMFSVKSAVLCSVKPVYPSDKTANGDHMFLHKLLPWKKKKICFAPKKKQWDSVKGGSARHMHHRKIFRNFHFWVCTHLTTTRRILGQCDLQKFVVNPRSILDVLYLSFLCHHYNNIYRPCC